MYAEMRKVKSQLDISNEYADVSRVSRDDLVDAGSLPALMMQFAFKSMEIVVETANEIIEAERKALIANFLMALLMFIPMAGSAAGAAGMTVVRSLLTLTGEVEAVGSLIYEVVDDPDNALLVVFGYLLGGGVSRQPFSEAAAARRSMKSAEVQKLGPIKKDLDRIDNVKGRSCKAK